MRKTKSRIAMDMLELILTMNKIEPDAHSAYQYEAAAKKVIFAITKGATKKEIVNLFDRMTDSNNWTLDFVAADFARAFFNRYKKGEIKHTAYYNYNGLAGDENLSKLQKEYAEKGAMFFR